MGTDVLSLKHITKTFNGKKAVDNLSISLGAGEIYGFLGPNGAGKTTTIRMIMDFIRPDSGNIHLFGENNKNNINSRMDKIGFLSADSNLYPNWTANQHINYVNKIRGGENNSKELVKLITLDSNIPYHKLSSGNQQKLGLVLAMMHNPKLLVLDEPTRGLDPLLQQEIYELLEKFKHNGGTVFMSSHNLAEVQKICDTIGIIREGKLVANENMSTIREMNVHQITIQFAELIDMNQFKASNVEIVKSTKHNLIANVSGDFNTFMQLVMKNKVLDLEMTHVSLEEMFMRYYQ